MSAFNFKRGDKVRLPKYRANGVVDCLFSGGGDDGPPEYYVVTDGRVNGWYRDEELELLGRYKSLVEERDELMKVLRKVAEWNRKYPRMAAKMTDINKEVEAILARQFTD